MSEASISERPIVFAIPKGRIFEEAENFFAKVGVIPETDFFDENSRKLMFDTNRADVKMIRVRSFDVATFVAFGAADIGICGSDVLMEFDYSEIYAPLDLEIGHCRLSIAAPNDFKDAKHWRDNSHLRVATKYVHATQSFFAREGVQAECIKLNGAMELAPMIGLTPYIVDLVSSGQTLKANGLKELEVIADISSRLIVNRVAFKTRGAGLEDMVQGFKDALGQQG